MPARPAKLRDGADVFADFPAFETGALVFGTVGGATTFAGVTVLVLLAVATYFDVVGARGATTAGGGITGGAVNILGAGLEVSKRPAGTLEAV